MKHVSLIALTLISSSAFARGTTRNSVAANSYTCMGADGTEIHYDTTSKTGNPLMHIQFKGEEVKLPAFPEIRLEESVMGQIVSVSDMHLVPIDGPTLHYSLVLPQVTLDASSSQEKFDSALIRTSVGNPFFGPHSGVAQHYDVVPVSCTATFNFS